VATAFLNTLAERDVRHLDMPMTAARVWQALESAGGT
jgi:hypothetical protein